ncbi:CPCC family cysteine-rich protein [Alcanivorax nanhaiticus]|uniref:CPCC family cysteine-rich protein n=1 Tax=Alcanivorax nanhaiticus TaxID=1177154 RepID=UPI00054E77C0|nr:CPCC family cysteine-rich protein [Alcanivorax nanhaiticus]
MRTPVWTDENQAVLDRRRAVFAGLGIDVRLNKRTQVVRVPCPCCGYPTLERRDAYEICHLCIWEDDGEDDANTQGWGGGPNGAYSLTEARANVVAFGTMYHPENNTTVTGNDSAEIVALKQELIGLYEALPSVGEDGLVAHWKGILDQERALRKAEEKRWKDLNR